LLIGLINIFRTSYELSKSKICPSETNPNNNNGQKKKIESKKNVTTIDDDGERRRRRRSRRPRNNDYDYDYDSTTSTTLSPRGGDDASSELQSKVEVTNRRRETKEEALRGLRQAGESIISFVGEDLQREGLRKTPDRFAQAMLYFTSGYDTVPQDVGEYFLLIDWRGTKHKHTKNTKTSERCCVRSRSG